MTAAPSASPGFRRYFTQLYGFLVKAFLQRLRSPVSTLIALLLPCVFILLLDVCYWKADKTATSAMEYGIGSDITMNVSTIVQYSFCTHPLSSLNTSWKQCTVADDLLTCLPNVANGTDLCYPTAKFSTVSGVLYSMYYGSGSFTLNNMDGHLSISAFVNQILKDDNPTYFGRNGRASLSHFGELVVASDDESVAQSFMEYCRTNSGMCGAVLHDTAYSTLEEAQSYAQKNADNVWAVVYLPSSLLSIKQTRASSFREYVPFTISMNYTATPFTFKQKNRDLNTRGSGGSGSAGYVLYWASGFMTLQNFVQQFYLTSQIADNADLLTAGYASFYDTTTAANGISAYLNQYSAAVIPMPTPEQYNNSFLTDWGYYLPLVCMLAALFTVANLTALIVEEKQNGMREAMLIMGMFRTCMFAGWYLSALVMDLVASLLVAIIFRIGFLEHVSFTVLFVLYFSFLHQNTAFVLMVSSLFSNPRVASWFSALSVFVFAIPFYTFPIGMHTVSYFFVSLVPCVGFSEAISQIVEQVSFGVHVGWEQAREGSFSVVDAIGMMWASFGVMVLLALYLDRVWPSGIGKRESAFFFLRYFRCCCCAPKEPSDELIPLYGENSRSELIEHSTEMVNPHDEDVGVMFKDVSKYYITGGFLGFLYTYFTGYFRPGDFRMALKSVSFALRRGEVSVLLGPNGSGKSTVMNIATSVISPDSGDVYICGYRASNEESRQNIGYCPQQNIIWEELTVKEHLTFYARMKGSRQVISDAVREALELTGMDQKADMKAGCLSGGEKRRLCMGIAVVGGSSVLFLDEPTAGLDVKGRREVATAIHRAREGRSVLLSTHLSEEADRLGDRLLVMNNGELSGEGSPEFLKTKTSAGHKLTCTMSSTSTADQGERQVAKLMDFIKENASFEHHHSTDSDAVQVIPKGCKLLGVERRGREVTFTIVASVEAAGLAPLLQKLEAHRETLHLERIAIGYSSVEDAFKHVVAEKQRKPEAVSGCPYAAVGEEPVVAAVAASPTTEDGEPTAATCVVEGEMSCLEAGVTEEYVNSSHFFRDFYTLFMKRLHYAKRDGRLVLFQVILPVAFLFLALFINLTRSARQPGITLDMTMYDDYKKGSDVFLSWGSFPGMTVPGFSMPAVANAFKVTSSTPASSYGTYYNPTVITPTRQVNATAQINAVLADEYYTHTTPRYVSLGTSNLVYQSGPPTASSLIMHNVSYTHAAPQALNTLYNVAYAQIFGTNAELVPKPVARNYPLYYGDFEKQLVDTSKQVVVGMFIILPFVLIPANTISYIVQEKKSGARHLQWLAGANMGAYWLSSFVFDLACYIGTVVLTYVIFVIFQRHEYTSSDMIGPAICLFLFFGLSSIPFSYLLSFFFDSPFAAQSIVLIINFFFGFIWVTIESMLGDSAFDFVTRTTKILRVLPSVSFGEGMYVIAGSSMGRLMYPGTTTVSMFSLLHFDERERSIFQGGVGTSLVYMSGTLVFSVIALVLLELFQVHHRIVRLFSSCFCKAGDRSQDADSGVAQDESVAVEEARVCGGVGEKDDFITVQHLRKKYYGSDAPAVADLSLGVHKGEVLALLGLNGAGKTTALSMLVGKEPTSSGDVYMNHYSILQNRARRYMGYCPQFDALLSKLTPTEHLYLYARLRGVPEEAIPQQASFLIQKLGLYGHRHQTASTLSGGNRRRLSLAIALIGNPTSVLLDEPTAGMDTFARAQTCTMLKGLIYDKSVILTTHLMDETEALADRVAVMSRGELKAIGSEAELQHFFSEDSSTFLVHAYFTQQETTTDVQGGVVSEEAVEELKAYLEKTLGALTTNTDGAVPSCEVYGVLGVGVVYSVSHSSLDTIYCAMADFNRDTAPNDDEVLPRVRYITVSRPSMEDILLAIN